MAIKVKKISENTARKIFTFFILSMLGFLGFVSVLFITGNMNYVVDIFNIFNSNMTIAFENIITLNFSALFEQWLYGVLSLLILAALGLPFILSSNLLSHKKNGSLKSNK